VKLFLSKKMEAELQEVKKEIAALYALLDKEELSKSEQYKVDNFEKELTRLDDYRKTLVTALATKRVEEQKKGILFSKALILDSRKVSRHKPNTATIDSRCILTNIAAVFQEEYELDVKEGDTATFGDVLWALGNPSKNPKYYRAPAAPKEGYTVPIHTRLSRKDGMYYRALNDFTNPKAHPLPIPEVDGEMKLILLWWPRFCSEKKNELKRLLILCFATFCLLDSFQSLIIVSTKFGAHFRGY
jgi:hypothetical protein